MTISSKPYFLRALYEWCGDNGYTPYLAVWVNDYTRVPRQFVENQEIILNIGMNAVKNLQMDNDWIMFSARFNGVAQEVMIPVGHVKGLFARETGEGMGFEVEEWLPEGEKNPPQSTENPENQNAKPLKKGLKLVK